MTYAKQSWTDFSTVIDKTHMDHIEDGIVALDIEPKVPTVVNGQWLKGVGGAAVWAPITQADVSLIPYVTTLPASPFDGQEVIWVDSLANSTYSWRMRYNAGFTGSAYKWECIGGTPKVLNWDQGGAAMNNPAFATASSWYWWVNAAGSVWPVPRSGVYVVRCKMFGQVISGGAADVYVVAANVNAVPGITPPAGNQAAFTASPPQAFTLYTAGVLTATAPTDSVGMAWSSTVLGGSTIKICWVEIIPARVL